MKTKVIFLVNENYGEFPDIFAFFPEENELDDCRLSYSHIGQHSSCCFEYAKESRLATKEEYKNLYNELTNLVGYDLEIVYNF